MAYQLMHPPLPPSRSCASFPTLSLLWFLLARRRFPEIGRLRSKADSLRQGIKSTMSRLMAGGEFSGMLAVSSTSCEVWVGCCCWFESHRSLERFLFFPTLSLLLFSHYMARSCSCCC